MRNAQVKLHDASVHRQNAQNNTQGLKKTVSVKKQEFVGMPFASLLKECYFGGTLIINAI